MNQSVASVLERFTREAATMKHSEQDVYALCRCLEKCFPFYTIVTSYIDGSSVHVFLDVNPAATITSTHIPKIQRIH